MDDLISRQEALYILDEEKREMENCLAQETDKNVMQYEDGYLAAVEKIAFSIKNSLGTEARRCKDCRHRYLENNIWHCPFGLSGGDDFFCGYSVQPSESSGNMSGTQNPLDCISRKAAIDEVAKGLKGVFVEYQDVAEKLLNNVPSVQPDIIQCKDCENWQTDWARVDAPDDHFCAVVDGFYDGDWYCADARRRNGGADMRGTANDD